MLYRTQFHYAVNKLWRLASGLMLVCLGAWLSVAQPPPVDFGNAAGDPVKLFQRGQDFHEHNQLAQALACYQEALKLRPEFPEAEYQSASALTALGRLSEAEAPLRRAIELVPEWPLPQAALGALLVQLKRQPEAETVLENALKLDEKNPAAWNALTDLRLQPPLQRGPLALLLTRLAQVMEQSEMPASVWVSRSAVERALNRLPEALASLSRALQINPRSLPARQQRAALLNETGRLEEALSDARALHAAAANSLPSALFLAQLYLKAEKPEEALRTLDSLRDEDRRQPEVTAFYNSILLSGPVNAENCATLEKLAQQQTNNAAFQARLGACYRTGDPARALEYYRRAAELEPRNANYATGYAAALVQGRRFPEAVAILRRVLAVAPDNQTAHANLAAALFEAKDYAGALEEFNWLLGKQPDNPAAHYFLGVTHDKLGQFPEALSAYQRFLSLATTDLNQLEIERVNLRLPSLRNQIKNGAGKKRKP